jgi:hypothetical protein
VQHLTGLSLTQPISIFGPFGIIGSFGLYQTASKAVLPPAKLRSLGWSRDQTPARGITEALTTAATQDAIIHYGFPFDRQQVHLTSFPLENCIRAPALATLRKTDVRGGGRWE